MNRDDIIRMAREAGFEVMDEDKYVNAHITDTLVHIDTAVERFAALVAAAERERLKWDGLHSCHPECDRPACVRTRKAVEAEREACAVIAFNAKTYIEAANAIRARGKNDSLVVHPSDDDWYYANKLKANNG